MLQPYTTIHPQSFKIGRGTVTELTLYYWIRYMGTVKGRREAIKKVYPYVLNCGDSGYW